MGTISVQTINNGDSLDANPIDVNFSTVVNEFNGNVDNNNIKTLAAIDGSKIAAGTIPSAQIKAEAGTAWSPSFGGFSVSPTVTSQYLQFGKLTIATLAEISAGTSNATNFTVTLPFAPAITTVLNVARVKDNGGYSTTQGTISLTAGSTTATLFRDPTGTTWTATNGKACDFTITYIAQ